MLNVQPDSITLGEWQSAQGNIFAYLIDEAQVTYLRDTDAESMKFLLASKHSQRTVRPFFENISAQEVGRHIDQVFSHVWEKDYELFTQLMELEGDAVSTIQDDATSKTDRTTSTNQTNKTSGFENEEMVDDTGSDITGTDGTENTASNTQKNISTTQSGLLAKAKAVRQRQFHQRVCREIADLLTLSIY